MAHNLPPNTSQLDPVLSAPIKKGSDDILALIEQVYLTAVQGAERRYEELNRCFEDYIQWSKTYQTSEFEKLSQARREVDYLKAQNIELQRQHQECTKEIQEMTARLSARTTSFESMESKLLALELAHKAASASSAVIISDLEQFGISHLGRNSISFNDQWPHLLWRLCASLESSSGSNLKLAEHTTVLSSESVRFIIEVLSTHLEAALEHQNNPGRDVRGIQSTQYTGAPQRIHLQLPPPYPTQHHVHGYQTQHRPIYLPQNSQIGGSSRELPRHLSTQQLPEVPASRQGHTRQQQHRVP